MGNLNYNQIRFETPFLILRTDQALSIHQKITPTNKESISQEDEKVLSILFGYPFRVTPQPEIETQTFL